MASRNQGFLGGPQVRKFEKKLEKFYNVKYAISVNSWTSGLIAIIGSLDVEPGDEIIVTPWTMCDCNCNFTLELYSKYLQILIRMITV